MAAEYENIMDLDQLNLEKIDYGRTILIISAMVCALFAAIGFLDAIGGIDAPSDWLTYTFLALIVLTGPYGFYASREVKRVRDIEARLPEFLRDVAEAGRFGMTLAQAIKVASRGRYGKLTPEIRRMAAQIDWGVPASEAIRLFAERVDTPLVKRMTSIIIKANIAGGSVADVLTMVAHDAREAMLSQSERKINMVTYVMVIYIAFAVFIATIFILNTTFLPKMMEAGASVAEGAEKAGITNMPVNIKTDVIPTIQILFVLAVIIHAVGDGILAGVLQDGQISGGMKHAFIMLLIGLVGTRLI
ncbi:type II secretion system F family protein [Methanomassiliicoccus luminyensis]|jgi:flagellar protein FlaJ|uniref:type II secretion system F family protein n=1 Tax=Methanomassiliicoccus luminyensis TaxID=1080712 RepID=UPI000370CB47|nr:type II secretion system F family protein [Methanomassiliicoccus luminyensis]